MDAGEGEDAFGASQVAPGWDGVGRVECEAAEGAHGPAARGGDAFDGDGLTGVDGMGELADNAGRELNFQAPLPPMAFQRRPPILAALLGAWARRRRQSTTSAVIASET